MGEGLKKRQPCAVTGVELHPYAAAEAEQRLDEVRRVDVTTDAADELPRDFDCIVIGDVLEHTADPWSVMRRLADHLGDGGAVVASIPNVRAWEVLEALGGGRWRYRPAGVLDEGHLRFFTVTDAAGLLSDAGLEVEEVQGVGGRGQGEWDAAGRPQSVRMGPLTLDFSDPSAQDFLVDQFLIRARKRAAPKAEPKLVSIVILCWNQLEFTRQCVESLLADDSHPYELILVDNGSTDETPAYLAGIPGAKVIRNEQNLGFPKGCNQGIQAATGEYILLLNNDTIVVPGLLSELVAAAESDPVIGLVGPVSNCVSGPQQVAASYGTTAELHRFAAGLAGQHRGALVEVERLVGFCLLVKREVLEKIGGFDERFGLGLFEDDDLCLRARQAGYRAVYAPGVFIHHYGSRTITALGLSDGSLLDENKRKFEEKWGVSLGPGGAAPGPGKRNATVSLCMIVRNEEENLPRCLGSVRGIFDEIIVVDTGSTDRTRAIAAEQGAKVFEFPWIDDFSAARNESLGHATSEWVMWMDADDSLDEQNRQELLSVLARLDDRAMAYVMKVRCLSSDDGSVTDVDHVKLFRNRPELRFEYRVHEQILPAIRRLEGAVAWTNVVIHHHGYTEPGARRGKLERDRRILAGELEREPNEPFCLFNLGCIEQELGSREAAIDALRRSIDASDPHASQVRKCYAMMVQIQRELSLVEAARATYDEGCVHYSGDPELLFQAGLLFRATGEHGEAERCFLGALSAPAEPYFSSMDPAIRGFKARHNLAVLYRETGRPNQAEAQWRAALGESPGFIPAWEGVGEILAQRGDVPALLDLGRQATTVGFPAMALMLEARAALLEQRHDEAIGKLRTILAESPGAVEPRRVLAHALVRAGRLDEAEPELRKLTELVPDDGEAHRDLALVLSDLAARGGKGPV